LLPRLSAKGEIHANPRRYLRDRHKRQFMQDFSPHPATQNLGKPWQRLGKILCCRCEAAIAEVRSAGQDSQIFSDFSSLYRLCPSHAAYAKWRDVDRAPICMGKVSRTVHKLSVTHTGFAFPLAKRDYHCFNKDQRALANGARLGFASIQGL
jgi:hypothetical protein